MRTLLPYSQRRHADPIWGMPALQVESLVVQYPRSKAIALQNVSLEIKEGAKVALIGANGAGKSTLLKAVAGLIKPVSGSLLIYGRKPGACHHRVAYLPQHGDIDWRFPVSLRRLALTGRYVHLGWLGQPTQEDHAIVRHRIAQLGLEYLSERQIGQLSGGQQQRALLARALAQGADLLLLDEPFNAVDADTREIIDRVLEELRDEGKTMVVATHDLGRVYHDFDRVYCLPEGKFMTAEREVSAMGAA